MSKLSCCPPRDEWLCFSRLLRMFVQPFLGLKVLRYLCGFLFPEQTTSPLLRFHCMLPTSLLLRHLSVLTPLRKVELMSDHYTVLSFVPTISVQFLSFRSEIFCLNKKDFLIKMIFVAFEENDNSTLLIKLLKQLTSTSQSTLSIPELMFVDCLTNSDILKLLSEFLFCLKKVPGSQS